MTPLRVAHVLNSPGRGGVPRVAHALIRHLDPARMAPHLFYLKPGDGPDLFDDMDIPKRVAGSSSKAAAMTELLAWLATHRIDILHTHSFRPNLYARMAGAALRPLGLRTVAHYHNDYSDKWQGETLAAERALAGATDAAVAVSAAVADHVAGVTRLHATVIPNGIDRDRITGGNRLAGRARLGLDPDHVAIGLIGRVCQQKGVDTFLGAALALHKDVPSARFLIVGDEEDRDLVRALRQRAEDEMPPGRVIWAGHREDMADILAALDIVAAPSRWEGFGLSLAEAMAAGVPVVASSVGGIPFVTGGAAALVAPDDPDALAKTLRTICRNNALRRTMISAGRVQSRRFDWAASAGKLQVLYDSLGSGSC